MNDIRFVIFMLIMRIALFICPETERKRLTSGLDEISRIRKLAEEAAELVPGDNEFTILVTYVRKA